MVELIGLPNSNLTSKSKFSIVRFITIRNWGKIHIKSNFSKTYAVKSLKSLFLYFTAATVNLHTLKLCCIPK